MNGSVSQHSFCVVTIMLAAVLVALPVGAERFDVRATSLDSLFMDGTEVGYGTVLNVKDFSAKGDGKNDDSPAFTAALKILAGKGGTLLVPPGTYLVGDLKIGSGTTIKGVGVPRPRLVKSAGTRTILDLTGEMVSGVRHTVHDVIIESLALHGRSVEDGFKEHVHNINAMGVRMLLIHDVLFEGFQGDGLYLGSRYSAAEPVAHNSDVIVANSEFRGVNSQNRNGISIIDCNDCILEDNSFCDIARYGMPGPIDIEPNELDETVQNIAIRNNKIKGTNGAAAVSIAIRAGSFVQSPHNIVIEHNYIEHATIGIRILRSYVQGSPMQPINIRVSRNTVHEIGRPLLIDGTSGITVENNDFSDSAAAVQVGCTFAATVSITENRFVRVGSKSGISGIQLCGALSAIVFRRNAFADMGSPEQGGSAIYFASGEMDTINFLNNIFSSPLGVTHTAIRSAKSAKLKNGKVLWTNNILKDDIQLGDFPETAK